MAVCGRGVVSLRPVLKIKINTAIVYLEIFCYVRAKGPGIKTLCRCILNIKFNIKLNIIFNIKLNIVLNIAMYRCVLKHQ